MTQPLFFQVKLSTIYDEAVDQVSAALKSEGFGVLTRIDVQATLKEKLNADFRPYVILGPAMSRWKPLMRVFWLRLSIQKRC